MKSYQLLLILALHFACSAPTIQESGDLSTPLDLEQQISVYNAQIIEAAKTKSFAFISDLYDDQSLLMPEYNPLIQSPKNIQNYYEAIYKREEIETYSRETIDLLNLDNRFIEIGLFTKVLTNGKSYRGKYMNVWRIDEEQQLKLRAASFGYLHQIENPNHLIVKSAAIVPPKPITIPWELEAYNALNERSVIIRNPERSANAYSDDGMYLPFADTIKAGKENLLKHYQAYYHYPAKIDSIQGVTYAYDQVKDGYIRYTGFYVDWQVPGLAGNTIGTGISYWKRAADNSLRIHRQIGLHIHQE